jgi:hypothetical protein
MLVGTALVMTQRVADASFSCSNTVHDGVAADGASTSTDTNINGVAGTMYVPAYVTGNLYGQGTSAADIAMLIDDSTEHFFQIGWYIGSADGLTTTSTPKYFVGEGTLSNSSETLTNVNVSLTGGSWHAFKLVQDENSSSSTFRHYLGYIDGSLVWTSTLSTAIEGRPRVTAETNFDCADMYGHASTSNGGATMQGHHANSTWSTWQQHLNDSFGEPATTPSCWLNDRVNGYTATFFAYDQC